MLETTMSDALVIPFPGHSVKSRAARAKVHGSPQIIIYPGVRHMPMPEPEIEDIFEIATAPLVRSPRKG
jgi:hypothetical protein